MAEVNRPVGTISRFGDYDTTVDDIIVQVIEVDRIVNVGEARRTTKDVQILQGDKKSVRLTRKMIESLYEFVRNE